MYVLLPCIVKELVFVHQFLTSFRHELLASSSGIGASPISAAAQLCAHSCLWIRWPIPGGETGSAEARSADVVKAMTQANNQPTRGTRALAIGAGGVG